MNTNTSNEPMSTESVQNVLNTITTKPEPPAANASAPTMAAANSTNASTNNPTKKNKNMRNQNNNKTKKRNNMSVNMADINKLCIDLFNHQIAMKLYHFQTVRYGAHKASDNYLEKYLNLMDRFMEVAQGIYGKITLKNYDIKGKSHDDTTIVGHLDGMINLWSTKIDTILNNHTDLATIRDELVSEANQLKYLLTFQ